MPPRPLVPLLALALLLSACGGDKQLTRADYVQRADAICADYNRKVAGLKTPRRPDEIVRFTDRALTELDTALDDERDLRPPPELEARKTRWLAAARKVRNDIAILRGAARKQDSVAIEAALEQGVKDDARSNALARKLGLKVCSKP